MSTWKGTIKKIRKDKRMDRFDNRLTRTRVLYRKVKLTGSAGKIEGSADALQVDQT